MCYNKLSHIARIIAPLSKPGSTTSRAVIMIPAPAGSSMRMRSLLPVKDSLVLTHSPIVTIAQFLFSIQADLQQDGQTS